MKPMARPIALFCTIMTSTQAVAPAGAAEAAFSGDVRIPMRDGVRLAGALYLPTNRAEKVGCLLSFSPYGATASGAPWWPERAEAWGVATLDFRLDVTSYVFKAGHRLRVEIAGSNSPHYEKAPDPATTRLLRGPSHLLLPTIPPPVRD